jgi:peptidyl-prolyl cis-trans isomerase C
MKALSSFVILCASIGWAQSPTPPAPLPSDPNAVIATFDDGSKMTAGDFLTLVPVLPDQYRALAQGDWQRFLKVYGMYRHAAAAAQEQKLGEKAPYKQGVDFAVTLALAQAEFLDYSASVTVSPEELEKYYNGHKDPYRRIKVSGIKIAFGTAANEANTSSVNASRVPRKVLSEDEARARAEKLVADIRAGADFTKLVQTESDDEASKAKGGDLGIWKVNDNVPDDLRAAVLGLEAGDVSNPIHQPGGYYIVHADAVTYAPLDEVKDAIFDQLKQEKAAQFLKDLEKNANVEFPKNDPAPSGATPEPKK